METHLRIKNPMRVTEFKSRAGASLFLGICIGKHVINHENAW